MPLKTSGMPKARRLLQRITPEIERQFEAANRDNAELIVSVSKALVPAKSGSTRAQIQTVPVGKTGQIMSFGRLSKVLEGGTQKRATKAGANRGVGPKLPFVAPAFDATKAQRKARNRKAVKTAISLAKNG